LRQIVDVVFRRALRHPRDDAPQKARQRARRVSRRIDSENDVAQGVVVDVVPADRRRPARLSRRARIDRGVARSVFGHIEAPDRLDAVPSSVCREFRPLLTRPVPISSRRRALERVGGGVFDAGALSSRR
jgi:hypothetical protein